MQLMQRCTVLYFCCWTQPKLHGVCTARKDFDSQLICADLFPKFFGDAAFAFTLPHATI
jgi:hypothetical protein